MNKQSKRIVPAFATEEEEAQWWYASEKFMTRSFSLP